jgi:hypothetical protein
VIQDHLVCFGLFNGSRATLSLQLRHSSEGLNRTKECLNYVLIARQRSDRIP